MDRLIKTGSQIYIRALKIVSDIYSWESIGFSDVPVQIIIKLRYVDRPILRDYQYNICWPSPKIFCRYLDVSFGLIHV